MCAAMEEKTVSVLDALLTELLTVRREIGRLRQIAAWVESSPERMAEFVQSQAAASPDTATKADS